MTHQPYDGATPAQLQSPFVRELLAIHDMFRDQLSAILEFVHEWQTESQPWSGANGSRAQVLAQAGVQYVHMLHHHHHLETSMMFPSLHKQGLDMSVVDKLNADHDVLAILLDKFADMVRDQPTINPEDIQEDLLRLSEALQTHLAYEETHVCPLLAHWSGW